VSVLGRYGANALKYWGTILESAYLGKSTADMWTAIHATQAKYGLDKPGASAPDVSVIRAYANRIVNGAAALAAAAPTDAITPNMMGTAPYTLSTPEQIATSPSYYVRYISVTQHTDGSVTGGWWSMQFSAAQFPGTVGELQAAVETNAAEMAALAAQQTGGKSGGTILVTGNLEISVV